MFSCVFALPAVVDFILSFPEFKELILSAVFFPALSLVNIFRCFGCSSLTHSPTNYWNCKNCHSQNFKNITNPHPETCISSNASLYSSYTASLNSGSTLNSSNPFCSICLHNQHLVINLLAQESSFSNRDSIMKRHPILCQKCEPKANQHLLTHYKKIFNICTRELSKNLPTSKRFNIWFFILWIFSQFVMLFSFLITICFHSRFWFPTKSTLIKHFNFLEAYFFSFSNISPIFTTVMKISNHRKKYITIHSSYSP